MLLLGFSFLLHPGEYAFTTTPEAAPFHICDVHLFINDHRLHPFHCADTELSLINHIALEFTSQKNGVRGELIGQSASGHPVFCPVQAMLTHINHDNAPLHLL